jgi:hypothetical protein
MLVYQYKQKCNLIHRSSFNQVIIQIKHYLIRNLFEFDKKKNPTKFFLQEVQKPEEIKTT